MAEVFSIPSDRREWVMTQQGHVLTAVRAALEREPRVNLHQYPVRMNFSDGVLTLEGEVAQVCADEGPQHSRDKSDLRCLFAPSPEDPADAV